MKLIVFLVLDILLANESNNFVKCSCDLRNSDSACLLCDRTPCECEHLALEDDGSKISIKKLILLFLKNVDAKCSNPDTCQDCRHCQHTCPKNSIIARLLRDILNKVDCDKKEESIREIIRKLQDPADCKEMPYQIHCDPHVQEVLKMILIKATNCKWKDKTSSRQNLYKYWFRASKDAIQKETVSKCGQRPDNQNLYPYEGEENTSMKDPDECNRNKNIHKCASECCKRCKSSRRPEHFICRRSLTDGCPISKSNLFSICTDCSHCRLLPKNSKNIVTLFCEECRPLNWPFVQFTRNGYPFRHYWERRNGIQISTPFLQVNDFRSKEEPTNGVYNPFHPRCNIPKKKKGRHSA